MEKVENACIPQVGHAIGVLLRVHSQAELQVLYPMAAMALANGEALVANARAEHQLLETVVVAWRRCALFYMYHIYHILND